MSREIMQQALPLLIAYQDYTGDSRIANECGEAIKALEAELAKPEHGFDRTASHMAGEYVDTAGTEQEPVAWVSLIQEAQAIVEGKYLFKRFIDGTPLSNDIAVWMTEFALKYAAPPKPEQEPVAYLYHDGSRPDAIPTDMMGTVVISRTRIGHYKNERPLYTSPPRKKLATPDATFIGEGSKPEQCDWNYDDDGMWQTGCGKELSFEMHHPEDSVKFCQGCGKAAHFVEPTDEGDQP